MTEKSNGAVIGLDLGGTKLSGALFLKDGTLLHLTEHLLGDRTGSEIGSFVLEQVLDIYEWGHSRGYLIESIGVCVPGISNPVNQTVWAPNIKGWEAYPLQREITEGLNMSSVRVSIESDRNCYILGEMWKGGARGCKNAIFVAVGTGIGMGIVADGQIINGASGVAGAIGWMALDKPYSPEYDPCGHLEFYTSGPGIARHAESLLQGGALSEYLDAGNVNTKDVFDAYDQNDPVAIKVITQCIEYWGMAVANLVSIFNPEKIIFGGGVFGPAIHLLKKISDEAEKWAQPISMQEVILEASTLEGNSGLYGAGLLALRNKPML